MPEQIEKADEKALYFRMLPNKTLSAKSDVHKHDSFKMMNLEDNNASTNLNCVI